VLQPVVEISTISLDPTLLHFDLELQKLMRRDKIGFTLTESELRLIPVVGQNIGIITGASKQLLVIVGYRSAVDRTVESLFSQICIALDVFEQLTKSRNSLFLTLGNAGVRAQIMFEIPIEILRLKVGLMILSGVDQSTVAAVFTEFEASELAKLAPGSITEYQRFRDFTLRL
jgi:hypothetical protein